MVEITITLTRSTEVGLGWFTRFGEFLYCCCFPPLPQLACSIHTTWSIDSSRSLCTPGILIPFGTEEHSVCPPYFPAQTAESRRCYSGCANITLWSASRPCLTMDWPRSGPKIVGRLTSFLQKGVEGRGKVRQCLIQRFMPSRNVGSEQSYDRTLMKCGYVLRALNWFEKLS